MYPCQKRLFLFALLLIHWFYMNGNIIKNYGLVKNNCWYLAHIYWESENVLMKRSPICDNFQPSIINLLSKILLCFFENNTISSCRVSSYHTINNNYLLFPWMPIFLFRLVSDSPATLAAKSHLMATKLPTSTSNAIIGTISFWIENNPM